MKVPWSERWWVWLVLGVVMILGSGYVYWDLAEWEAQPGGGPKSMNWFAALLYRIGGKWLLSGLVLAVGVFLTVAGLCRWRSQNANKPPTPEADSG